MGEVYKVLHIHLNTVRVVKLMRSTLKDSGADFRAALKIDPALRLEPSHFSPKLIAFFERTAAGSARR